VLVERSETHKKGGGIVGFDGFVLNVVSYKFIVFAVNFEGKRVFFPEILLA
jgi:hypothetical protein